jgi:hypothetical protein
MNAEDVVRVVALLARTSSLPLAAMPLVEDMRFIRGAFLGGDGGKFSDSCGPLRLMLSSRTDIDELGARWATVNLVGLATTLR